VIHDSIKGFRIEKATAAEDCTLFLARKKPDDGSKVFGLLFKNDITRIAGMISYAYCFSFIALLSEK